MKVLKYVCFDEERKIGLVAESLENLISKVRTKHKVFFHYIIALCLLWLLNDYFIVYTEFL